MLSKRKKREIRTTATITWFGIVFGAFIALLIGVPDKTDKLFSILALVLFGYIVYTEWIKSL